MPSAVGSQVVATPIWVLWLQTPVLKFAQQTSEAPVFQVLSGQAFPIAFFLQRRAILCSLNVLPRQHVQRLSLLNETGLL